MKRIITSLIAIFIFGISSAQTPVIDGDLMLCPFTDGTASVTNAQVYDSYQWYYKYWFTSDEFELIDGATSESFTYDWYTYDQALLKVVVTLDGETYESNTIQIDSYAWLPMFTMYELDENAYFDPDTGTIMLCEGASFEISINNPPYDSSITWYKDGVALEDATDSTLLITGPGTYEVSAAPSFCPDNISYSIPIVVATDPDCSLQVPDNRMQPISIYPNPATDQISINNGQFISSYAIADLSGKTIQNGIFANEKRIDITALASGLYVLQLWGDNSMSVHKIIKH